MGVKEREYDAESTPNNFKSRLPLRALGGLSIASGLSAVCYAIYEVTSTNYFTIIQGEADVYVGVPIILAGAYALYKSGLFGEDE
ncbi:MAG TPA: hypothetical protein VFN31_00115 [Candidatus Saccharimonadales bacterium]|nr:hypothetical protein [Candidatus Saccharimonadales bacterium]